MERVELLVYALAGMFAALAGIMYASRMDAGQPSVGEGWLMKAITAADPRWHIAKRWTGNNSRNRVWYSPNRGTRERIISYERFGVLGAGVVIGAIPCASFADSVRRSYCVPPHVLSPRPEERLFTNLTT